MEKQRITIKTVENGYVVEVQGINEVDIYIFADRKAVLEFLDVQLETI